ncbi:winged helix-turn-helix transcriptional regulator [Nocardioides sp. T2.26MG-1]|uniref:winged helix-turn-helix transcriptional regulator n=1 Tax=Nocardioides sp. T2.26MG-1 TaxID=3041166 RepID=UPI00406C1AE9
MRVSPGASSLPASSLDGVFPAGCPSRTVLEHVTSKWGLLILIALSEGEHRWSELRRRADGISESPVPEDPGTRRTRSSRR